MMHPTPQAADDGSGGDETVQPAGRSISNWLIVPHVYVTGSVTLRVPPASTWLGETQAKPPGVQVAVGVGVCVAVIEEVTVVETVAV